MDENNHAFLTWLKFCIENSSKPHRELLFDETGITHPLTINFGAMPFSAEQSWTNFQDAKSREFIHAYADNGSVYYRFQISDRGLAFIQTNYRTWWQRQIDRLRDSVLTIILAVLVALACQWALVFLGPN